MRLSCRTNAHCVLTARRESSVPIGHDSVFTAEHLCAIALEVGRAKDKARLLQFIEAGAFEAARFQSILTRHGLTSRWQQFERQFFRDQP